MFSKSLIFSTLFLTILYAGAAFPETKLPDSAIMLWPSAAPKGNPDEDFQPYLIPFLLETKEARGAVIALPGGGYSGRAPHEADPIAERINEAGLHAFVCHYRVKPNQHPAPWLDATRAIRFVREHAKEWNILPEHIAILGFSAGGHLAASTGTLDLQVDGLPDDDIQKQKGRPDAMVLCYPVIGYAMHRGSFNNLLGDSATPELLESLSLEKQVTDKTPPAFLWSTADDEAVPVENSMMFSLALRKKGIPFELHVYPHGEHGLGLSADDEHIATWMPLCIEWLKGMGW